MGVQGGYEPRIEAIVKMKKMGMESGRGWGVWPGDVRVDMNQELFIVKMQKIWSRTGAVGGGGGWRGQGGCERRIAVTMKCNKKVVGVGPGVGGRTRP